MALDGNLIKVLIFDLDDTLFDTSGLLIGPATREACYAMIRSGLNASVEECVRFRTEFIASQRLGDPFDLMVKKFGIRDGAQAHVTVEAGRRAFHHRPVDEDICMLPGALRILEILKLHFRLFLVTLGDPTTQQVKVNKLKLTNYFEKILWADVQKTSSKVEAFRQVRHLCSGVNDAKEFLCIGNRIDSEIRDGKTLGMQTLLIRCGESASWQPQHLDETPDAEIKNLGDILCLLKLQPK